MLYLQHLHEILRVLNANKSSSVDSKMDTASNLAAFLCNLDNFCCKKMVSSGYLCHLHDDHGICACNQKKPLVIPERMYCYSRVDALSSMYSASTSSLCDESVFQVRYVSN